MFPYQPIRGQSPMPPPSQFANEIARLMRDPDAMRPEWERMQRSGGRSHYDPTQPRVPAGNSDGGQWTDTGQGAGVQPANSSEEIAKEIARLMQDPDAPRHGREGMQAFGPGVPAGHPEHRERTDTGSAITPYDRTEGEQPQLAQFSPNRPPVRPGPIGVLLSLFAALSARNTPTQRATFDFNAREFLRDPLRELDRANVRQLNQREVENVCRKLDDVQRRTDRIASTVRADRPDSTAQQHGTAVHTRIAQEINEPRKPDGSPKDPNYRAEVSYWKMEEDGVYGRKDSIRIDVLENAGRGVVCVYDIKTGQSRRSGLNLDRMLEIAKNVLGAYPHVQRVIITEVRPRR
ncbi:MAG: hypothetical protein GEU95_07670 [Rhizobiales bacterium]|nr:hypothetical protein [Hyphomicrobiales bacterium]